MVNGRWLQWLAKGLASLQAMPQMATSKGFDLKDFRQHLRTMKVCLMTVEGVGVVG